MLRMNWIEFDCVFCILFYTFIYLIIIIIIVGHYCPPLLSLFVSIYFGRHRRPSGCVPCVCVCKVKCQRLVCCRQVKGNLNESKFYHRQFWPSTDDDETDWNDDDHDRTLKNVSSMIKQNWTGDTRGRMGIVIKWTGDKEWVQE